MGTLIPEEASQTGTNIHYEYQKYYFISLRVTIYRSILQSLEVWKLHLLLCSLVFPKVILLLYEYMYICVCVCLWMCMYHLQELVYYNVYYMLCYMCILYTYIFPRDKLEMSKCKLLLFGKLTLIEVFRGNTKLPNTNKHHTVCNR